MLDPRHIAFCAALAITACALLWAGASDVRRYLIPNRCSAAIAGAYVLALTALAPLEWLAGVATGMAALGVGLALFARGWVGGGDVKLAAAIALWAGPGRASDFMSVTAVCGAALAIFMLSPLRRLMPIGPDGAAAGLHQPMPFGVPLAAGGLWLVVSHFMSLQP